MTEPLRTHLKPDSLSLASDGVRVDPITEEQQADAYACLTRHNATDLADALGIPKEART